MLATKLHLILLNAFAKLDCKVLQCKRRLLNNDEHGKSVGAIDRTAMISNASLDTIHSNKLLQSTHPFLFPTNIQFNSILVRLGVSIYLFDFFFVFIDKKHFLFHHSVAHISTNFSNLYLHEVFIIVNYNNCILFSATV